MAKRLKIERLISEFRRKGGGSRRTIIKAVGGKLDKGDSAFHQEIMQLDDERDGPTTIEVVQTRTCSFGHTVDDKVRVTGICEVGGEVLCAMKNCMLQCVHCGAVVCRVHSTTYGDKTYCQKHKWIHYWKMFWRLD
jgi:hypothetical protein